MRHMALRRLRAVLGAASGLAIAMTLLLGLWPYQPLGRDGIQTIPQVLLGSRSLLPTNGVSWLGKEPGLRFAEHGSVFSRGEFPSTGDVSGCALEIWLEPARQKGGATILAFSTREMPVAFQMRQVMDGLVIWHAFRPPKKGAGQWLSVEHVIHPGQRLLITLSSDDHGTTVYVNGELARRANWFVMNSDLRGKLVIGDGPEGLDRWKGIVRGLAIYRAPVSSSQVRQHLQNWQTGDSEVGRSEASLYARYLFREGSGKVAKSDVGDAPELMIPKMFSDLRPALLKPFWLEFSPSWDYCLDVVVNIIGFMPLGFVLCLFLLQGKRDHPLRTAAVLGFVISLIIEVGQYFLPFRSSGTTDLITNTIGAALGGWLACGRVGAASLDWLKKLLRVEHESSDVRPGRG